MGNLTDFGCLCPGSVIDFAGISDRDVEKTILGTYDIVYHFKHEHGSLPRQPPPLENHALFAVFDDRTQLFTTTLHYVQHIHVWVH